ncbi:hypothetical protein PGAL8A_00121800 [Plasmodium gallinaceum]|uniref:Uncharacterized protein n=1 Tax=Plasmodium gallinaceum TaxID=5849 RepID=A0A1J1GQE1_PLAGA|nr:hypothetical protein PGAL8A_00121800 [Plasmodium gallinaceum]CRG93511.1 hypothetical protein PGAL8A_00121800 [Plasmodium gallinaceum]
MYSNNIKDNLIYNEEYNNSLYTKYDYINKNKENILNGINKVYQDNYTLKENNCKSDNHQIYKIILKTGDNNYIYYNNQVNKYNLKKESNLNIAKVSNIKSIFNKNNLKKQKKKVSFLDECKTLYYERKLSQELTCGINIKIKNDKDEKKKKIVNSIVVNNNDEKKKKIVNSIVLNNNNEKKNEIVNSTALKNNDEKKNEIVNTTALKNNDEKKNNKNLNEKSIIQNSTIYKKTKCKSVNFNLTKHNLKNDSKDIIFNILSKKISEKKTNNIQINFNKNMSQKNIFLNINPNMICKLKAKDNKHICINDEKNINFSNNNVFTNEKKRLIFNKYILNIKKETDKKKNSDKYFLRQTNNHFLNVFNKEGNTKLKRNNKIFKRNIKNNNIKKKIVENSYNSNNNNNNNNKINKNSNIEDNYFKTSQNNDCNISYLKLCNTNRFSLKNKTSYKLITNHKVKMLEENVDKNKENSNNIRYLNKLKINKEFFLNKVNTIKLKNDTKNIYHVINKSVHNKEINNHCNVKTNDKIVTKSLNSNLEKKQYDEKIEHINLKGELNNYKKVDTNTNPVIVEKIKNYNNSFYIKTNHKNIYILGAKRNDRLVINKEQGYERISISKDTEKIENKKKLFEDKNILNEEKPSKEIINFFRQNAYPNNENIILKKNKNKIEKQKQIEEKEQNIRKDKKVKIKKKNKDIYFEKYIVIDKGKHKNKQKKSKYEQNNKIKRKEVKDEVIRKLHLNIKQGKKETKNIDNKCKVLEKKKVKYEEIKSKTRKDKEIQNINIDRKNKKLKIKDKKTITNICKSNLRNQMNYIKSCKLVKNNSKRFKNIIDVCKLSIRKKKKKKKKIFN